MTTRCHACDEEISDNAKICRYCHSKQSKALDYLSKNFGPGTLIISTLSLLVSFYAVYLSTLNEPAAPRIIVQADRFEALSFSFFVANLGNLPTTVRDFDLTIRLKQADGEHIARAGFSISAVEIPPKENHFFRVYYSEFVPRYTSWTPSKDELNPFTLDFLYGASGFGSNLECAIEVFFSSRRYFPSNIDASVATVNGVCSSAMEWFAENVGPLSDSDKAK